MTTRDCFEVDLWLQDCKTFPNALIVLRVILAFPISVAKGEITFSKLKKNIYNLTSVQIEIVNFISFENYIAKSVDTEKLRIHKSKS